jgi:hypothetical protein
VNKISITLGAKTVRLARLVICNPSKIRSRCDPASSKLDDAPWGDFPAATVTRDPAATIRERKFIWIAFSSVLVVDRPGRSTVVPVGHG